MALSVGSGARSASEAGRSNTRPLRVLHVLGSLNRGGVETWLMQVLRAIDRDRFQMDFCCLGGQAGVYAPEAAALGSQVLSCRLTKNLPLFNRSFGRILASGSYDVVHSHVHYFSGYILWRAAKSGIRGRIAHSFTAPPEAGESFRRRIYRLMMRHWIFRYATFGLGNSEEAMRTLFGRAWRGDARWQLLYCGIDLTPFSAMSSVSTVRPQYGIPQDAVVIGHVGRLTPVKNHQFLIEVAQEACRRHSNVWFLLVGDGPLGHQLQEDVGRRGLVRVVFTGAVPCIQPYLRSMDLFLFPSLWEGLPQSVIEAQAAGLRCLCSDSITREVAIVPNAVRFLPLAVGPKVWAESCLEMAREPRIDSVYALEKLAESPFTIEESVRRLECLYEKANLP